MGGIIECGSIFHGISYARAYLNLSFYLSGEIAFTHIFASAQAILYTNQTNRRGAITIPPSLHEWSRFPTIKLYRINMTDIQQTYFLIQEDKFWPGYQSNRLGFPGRCSRESVKFSSAIARFMAI